MDIKIFEDERHEVFSGNKKREVYKSFKSFIEKA
jgi:hypothetical protein